MAKSKPLMTYVCITGNESNPEDLRQRLEKVMSTPAPLLAELRLDYLSLSPNECFRFLLSLPEDWSSRLVLTQRLSASGPAAGGRCRWDIPTWQNWWREVIRLRPWYAVDLDWIVVDELANESLSWPQEFRSKHALFSVHGTLDEIEVQLPDLVASAKLHGVGVKIAASVKGAKDLARLARLRESLVDLPLQVVVAMGQAGRAWRWSRLAGGISYFVLDQNSTTALGQDNLENVLPYLKNKRFPELYILWSTDSLNKRGELAWNRSFINRGLTARYFNLACASEDFDPGLSLGDKKAWAEDALFWMRAAHIRGASVTRPFKEVFPLIIPSADASINTITDIAGEWRLDNTDGSAVLKILKDRGIASTILIGSGGTAQGLKACFEKANHPFYLWKREQGKLPALGSAASNEAIISTWPAEYQEILVQELEQVVAKNPNFRPRLCIDAQLKFELHESPLAIWCEKNNIPYIAGAIWWREQAQQQEVLWGLQKTNLAARLLKFIPHSKSETIRALWIALAKAGDTEIVNPGLARDVEVVRAMVSAFGAKIKEIGSIWKITAPATLELPKQTLDAKDCGAALRMLLPWVCAAKKGQLSVTADLALQNRPMSEFFETLALTQTWPVNISAGQAFPKALSLQETSQFASGFVLAAAAAVARKPAQSIHFSLPTNSTSGSYLSMTVAMLRDAGFEIKQSLHDLAVISNRKNNWVCDIDLDMGALAYLEVLSRQQGWGLRLPWSSLRQSDGAFAQFQQPVVDLSQCPDLAPVLWAQALLTRQSLTVINTPQLRFKESNRGLALVEASRILGATAECHADGFTVDATRWNAPLRNTLLATHSDHRLSMAYGLIEFYYPTVQPDDRECVVKSFPQFWQMLSCAREMSL
jgi:3-phosphoshikimate 1-carboxyvinyltransferase